MRAQEKVNYQRRVILLIFCFFILRLFVAFLLELGNDEAYYWTYSKFLKWNYFDHPPMIAYTIRLFTANLLLQDHEIFIRLGSVVGGALSTWFIYKATTCYSSERAGWFAACLYSTSFYAGILAGFHAMPDAPQMVFWTLCLCVLAKISVEDRNWFYWIVFGISAGFCIMSKVHGAFLWFGLGIYALLEKRAWLRMPQLYVSLFLSLLISCPIITWNIQNDFATYLFHSSRVTINQFTINWKAFLEELSGQFFFNNPFHIIILVFALAAMRKNQVLKKESLILFNYIALPLAIVLLIIALFRDTLPHWNGPAYISLIPLGGVFLASIKENSIYTKLLRYGMIGFVAFIIGWPIITKYYPGTYGNKNEIELGAGDVTLDKFGWAYGGEQFAQLYKSEVSKGSIPDGAPLICYKWWGAHVEYYFCRPLGIEMIGLGGMNTLHEYYWTNEEKISKVGIDTTLCIVPSDEYYDVHARYSTYYDKIDSLTTISILRNKLPAHNFYLYRLSGWKGKIPYVK
jgi:4-amino-4-deoxy-L-arabinose transferase-like glycosyltransferase